MDTRIQMFDKELKRFIQNCNDNSKDRLSAVQNKLQDLADLSFKIHTLNDNLLAVKSLKVTALVEKGKLVLEIPGHDRIIINGAPGKVPYISDSTSEYSYVRGERDGEEPCTEEDFKNLEIFTRSFYETAYNLIKDLQSIKHDIKFDKTMCYNVWIQLIHHNRDRQQSELDSFGISTSGPQIKPIKRGGKKGLNDPGLYNNEEELYDCLSNIILN